MLLFASTSPRFPFQAFPSPLFFICLFNKPLSYNKHLYTKIETEPAYKCLAQKYFFLNSSYILTFFLHLILPLSFTIRIFISSSEPFNKRFKGALLGDERFKKGRGTRVLKVELLFSRLGKEHWTVNYTRSSML